MVVLDASALIPLARIGRLGLLHDAFGEVATTEAVREEVVAEGQPGAAALAAFLEDVTIHPPPDRAGDVAALEGVTPADASVVLLADDLEDRLLANDKALIEVARSHGVETWWVTTLLLSVTQDGILPPEEAQHVLYDLVEAGMNLSPQVFVRVRRELGELGA